MRLPGALIKARDALATLLLSFAGGGAFFLVGAPAAWLTGGVLAVALAEFRGVRTHTPSLLRDISYVTLGMALGSSVSPDTLGQLGQWPVSLAVMGVSTVLVLIVSQSYLVHLGGWGRRTAFFAAVPGALGYVLALADQSGANIKLVAIAQMFRLLGLVILLPGSMAALGLHAGPADAVVQTLSIPQIGLLAGGALASAGIFALLRLPLPLLLGPLLASMVAYGGGLVSGSMPAVVLTGAIVVLAGHFGQRFRGLDRTLLRHAAAASAGAFVASVAVAASIAIALSLLSDIPLSWLLVAFAPGGFDTMLILALSLNLDSAFIATHHVARFICVVVALPVAVVALRLVDRNGRGGGVGGGGGKED